MKNIPSQSKQWKQANQSDLFGNISVTKNITFDIEGYLQLSHSPRATLNSTSSASFDQGMVIIRSENHGFLYATRDALWQVGTEILASVPVLASDTNTPNLSTDDKVDAKWFGGLLALSQEDDLDYYTPGTDTWTDTNIALTNTAQSQHPLALFLSLSYLAVANVNSVGVYSSPLTATPTLVRTLTLLADFYITSMCYFNQNLYIGTMNRSGGHAYLYVWNGEGTAAQSAFEVDSNIIFDVCVFQDSVVCVAGNGSLLRFNGGGFTMLDAFPIYYTERTLTDETSINIYKNSLKSSGDLLFFNFIDNQNSQHKMLNMPEGIWCYDPKIGLYHRYSSSNSTISRQINLATASVNPTTNQITVTAAPFTGTEVFYRDGGGTALAPLVDETKYYVIYVDSTHIKLALTRTDALAGTAIDLTGTGNAGQDLIFFPNTDYGQFFTESANAMTTIDIPVSNTQYGINLVWSAGLRPRQISGSENYLIAPSDAVESRGYFITPKIFSNQVTDVFDLITLKFSPLMSDIDKIIIKYRTYDDGLLEINPVNDTANIAITWTSSTTFTVAGTDWANAMVGDEIEVLQGAAGGLLAHITTISGSGTYTITIDETFYDYTSGDTSYAVFRNWKKWKTISYGDANANKYYISEQLGATGKFIQLKVELRGVGIRIEDLLIDDKYQLTAQK